MEVVRVPVVVIGGGQAGLATAYHLRRAGLAPADGFVVLDREPAPGGAWRGVWDGLRLFSPARHSSLPGRPMPPWREEGYPSAEHVRAYLADYEQRYDVPVRRPVTVEAVERAGDGRLEVRAGATTYAAQVVVSATGTWRRPFWPAYPVAETFQGTQLHSASYRRPEDLAGRRVVVVGGGNIAAQVLAEVSTLADTTWVTPRPPRFMPDDVDGHALFAAATRRVVGGPVGDEGVGGLGDIVMVPSVKDARDRGVLRAEPMFSRLVPEGVAWADGRVLSADVVLWCTGFRPVLDHLRPLRLRGPDGTIATDPRHPTRALAEPRLHLVGYGDWTGAASATLIGVGRTARAAAAEILATLDRSLGAAGGGSRTVAATSDAEG